MPTLSLSYLSSQTHSPGQRKKRRPAKRPSSTSELKQNWIGEVLFGVAPVFSALVARRRKIHKICIQESADLSKRKDRKLIEQQLAAARADNIDIQYHTKHDLNMIATNQVHQGFLLDCSPLEFEGLEEMPSGGNSKPYPVWLALDEIYDPHNLGAMIRTAVFLGVTGVIVSKKNSAPLSATVSKVSSGAMELIPVHSCQQMPKLLRSALSAGWDVIGSDIGREAISIEECTLQAPTILVMGNEAYGLRHTVRQNCSRLVQIGAADRRSLLDSLNVSVAAGILMAQLTLTNAKSGSKA